MTEKKTTKTAAASKATPATAPAQEAASAFSERVTEGAREFVKRSASTAKDRTEGAYDASKRYTANVEDFLVRAARGYADILGNVADAAYTNVNHTIATAEKLAEAKSVSDAMQIQADYVRESASRNMENARSAFDYAREVVVENTETLRETASKLVTSNKAA